MRLKFRVEEKIYDDGRTRFFPQVGDWWHGWRYKNGEKIQSSLVAEMNRRHMIVMFTNYRRSK